MTQPPAFQLYAADFYMDTISWSPEEIGAYLRLLLTEWINGPLENDPKALAAICGLNTDKNWKRSWTRISPKILKKFSIVTQNCLKNYSALNPNDLGKLVNLRLEKEREKQIIWREKSRLGGLKSGEIRRKVLEPPLNHPLNQKATLQSSSSIKKERTKERKKKAEEVLAYLNEKKGSRYQRTDEIIARLKDGGTVEECKKSIDIKSQDPHFIENPQHLNPQTLFRKKHWDKYLNEKHKPKDLWG